jgi:hypothetical protein
MVLSVLSRRAFIALMQADARLVEDVQDAHQPAAVWVASRMRCASPRKATWAERESVR